VAAGGVVRRRRLEMAGRARSGRCGYGGYGGAAEAAGFGRAAAGFWLCLGGEVAAVVHYV
jgi:hypothetical protein